MWLTSLRLNHAFNRGVLEISPSTLKCKNNSLENEEMMIFLARRRKPSVCASRMYIFAPAGIFKRQKTAGLSGSLPVCHSFSRPRMILLINIFQSRFCHVGIDLRCRNIGMAEHFLHSPQIGAVFEKMSGERMP